MQDDHDNEESSHKYTEMKKTQFLAELMTDSDLEHISFTLFDRKMRDPDISHELAALLSFHLSEKYKREYDFEQLKVNLPFVDLALFKDLRDARITMTQLKARVAERRGFAKYKVFDDLFPELSLEERETLKKRDKNSFLFGKNPKPEDFTRQLQPWESNPRCLRSIKYHHKKGSNNRNRYSIPYAGAKKKFVRVKNEVAAASSNKKDNTNDTAVKEPASRSSKAKNQGGNPLINEKSLISKKARISKEHELKKHLTTLNNLKRKLAR